MKYSNDFGAMAHKQEVSSRLTIKTDTGYMDNLVNLPVADSFWRRQWERGYYNYHAHRRVSRQLAGVVSFIGMMGHRALRLAD